MRWTPILMFLFNVESLPPVRWRLFETVLWLICSLPSPSRYVINNEKEAVSPKKKGTKVTPYYVLEVEGGKEVVLKMRLANRELSIAPFGRDFDTIFDDRIREADDFYNAIIPSTIGPQQKLISRQAYAGQRQGSYSRS